MVNREWRTGLIVLAALVAGALLGQSGLLSRAEGVSEGQTGGVVALIGDQLNGYAPVVLVNTQDQTVVLYEYSYYNHKLEMTSARTFRYDKLLSDYRTEGVTVNQVKDYVTQR